MAHPIREPTREERDRQTRNAREAGDAVRGTKRHADIADQEERQHAVQAEARPDPGGEDEHHGPHGWVAEQAGHGLKARRLALPASPMARKGEAAAQENRHASHDGQDAAPRDAGKEDFRQERRRDEGEVGRQLVKGERLAPVGVLDQMRDGRDTGGQVQARPGADENQPDPHRPQGRGERQARHGDPDGDGRRHDRVPMGEAPGDDARPRRPVA